MERMWANLRMNELYYRIQSYFNRTARTVVFTGWVPDSRVKSLDDGIRRVTANRCYLEWHVPDDPGAEEGLGKRASLSYQSDRTDRSSQAGNPGARPVRSVIQSFHA